MSNVSEITQHLIDIVQANSDLQDVWIRGKISNIRSIQNGPLNFTIKDSNEKIDCVIFDNGTSLQTDLPSEGSGVYIKGQIFIYGVSSEYRFKVTDINLPENPLPNQSVSVAALTEVLENTVADHLGEGQGQISDIYEANTGWTNFKLKTATANETLSNSIECSLPPSIANNLPFPLTEGEEVSVKGNFKIFSARNTYQIIINNSADIVRVPEVLADPPITRCNQCNQCHDTNYELCPMCHYAQVEHEGIVVGAVMRYFNRFKDFSTKQEYPIQFGAKQGRADVVLKDSKNKLSVIAECKHIGYDGTSGIDQLESYLNASGTTLGLFADDTDPNGWTFLKNLGKGKFTEITRSDFETMVRDEKAQPFPEQPNPNPTPLPIPSNPAPRLWQYITGVLGVALCICLTVLIMQLDEKNRQIRDNTRIITQLKHDNTRLTEKNTQIQDNTKAISQLRNKIETLANEKQALQEQITEKDKQLEEYTSKNSKLESEIADLREQITEKPQESDSEKLPPQNSDVKNPIEPEPPPLKPISELLNINTASIKELQTLPGIGPAKAQDIIEYREKHGKFDSVEDITKIHGIAEKTLENLRKFISAE